MLEGGNDQRLRFTFKLTKLVLPGTVLHFRVSKPNGGNEGVLESEDFGFRVPAPAFGPPRIDDVRLDKNNTTLTVTGDGFFDDALDVKLVTPRGETLEGDQIKLGTRTTKKLTLDIPSGKKEPGCRGVQVFVGKERRFAPHADKFAIVPAPTLKKAEVSGKQIVLTGDQLRDTKDCGGKELKFQLEKKDKTDHDKAIDLTIMSTSPTKWVVRLPAQAESGDWNVQMWLGGETAGGLVKLDRP